MNNLFDEIRLGDVRRLAEEDGWGALSILPKIAAILWAKTVCWKQHNKKVDHFDRSVLYYLYGSVEHFPYDSIRWPVNHYLVVDETYTAMLAILYCGNDDWQIIVLHRPGLTEKTGLQLLSESWKKNHSNTPASEPQPKD